MARFLLTRLILTMPVLFLVSVMAFGLIWLVPGDPASVFLDASASPEALARIRAQLGLDKPFYLQVIEWYGRALRGDLGQSLLLNRSVTQAILERLPVTLSLLSLALVIAILLGGAAGVLAAVRHNRAADQSIMILALLGLSLPEFWLGLVSIYAFAVTLGWLPTGDYKPFSAGFIAWARHMAMPAAVLAAVQMGFLARMTRSAMLEVLQQDYIRTARAKGISELRIIGRHGLANALIPVITVVGIMTGNLLGGAVVTEQVFSLPGVGRLIIGGILGRDFPVIQGGLLFLAVIYLTVNLAVDLAYALIDPRVRLG